MSRFLSMVAPLTVISMRTAGAGDSDRAEDRVGDRAEDPPGETWWAEWSADGHGELTPTLLIQPLVDTSIEYWISGRVSLGSNETVWTQGPYEAEPVSTMKIELQIPVEAYRSDVQAAALADLLVHVTGYRDGELIENIAAPPVKIAWPDGPKNTPLILYRRDAIDEAPMGILGMSVAAERDGEPTGGVPADMVTP